SEISMAVPGASGEYAGVSTASASSTGSFGTWSSSSLAASATAESSSSGALEAAASDGWGEKDGAEHETRPATRSRPARAVATMCTAFNARRRITTLIVLGRYRLSTLSVIRVIRLIVTVTFVVFRRCLFFELLQKGRGVELGVVILGQRLLLAHGLLLYLGGFNRAGDKVFDRANVIGHVRDETICIDDVRKTLRGFRCLADGLFNGFCKLHRQRSFQDNNWRFNSVLGLRLLGCLDAISRVRIHDVVVLLVHILDGGQAVCVRRGRRDESEDLSCLVHDVLFKHEAAFFDLGAKEIRNLFGITIQ